MSGPDNRKEIVRIDCPTCKGKGYTSKAGVEESCEACGASGMLSKEVDYRFEDSFKGEMLKRTPEELAEIFELPVEQITDSGHSDGS